MTWSPPVRPYQCTADPECPRGTAVDGGRCWHHQPPDPPEYTAAGLAIGARTLPLHGGSSGAGSWSTLLPQLLGRVNHADTPPT